LEFEFMNYLEIVTRSNYSTIANSHTLKFNTAHTKLSQFFTSRVLVTDPKNVLHLCPYRLANVSQSQSYVTTEGQSASLSWNKAPI
jgi:hypothetical protein